MSHRLRSPQAKEAVTGRSGRRALRLATAVTAGCCWLACVGVALGLPGFGTAPQTLAGTSGTTQTELFTMQAGCHPGYDRVVVRSRSRTPEARVRYVASIIAPSGASVPLLGKGKLLAVLDPARGHTLAG